MLSTVAPRGDDFIAKTDLIKRADLFAEIAHKTRAKDSPSGQLRKYTNEPYIVHPRNVAKLVGEAFLPETAVAAALLHDVLEDTFTYSRELREHFGDEVTALVIEVTDVSEPHHGNRAARKALDRAHLALASPHGQSIKVADLIDNTRSIAKYDPKFAKVYLPEKRAILEVLTKANPILLAQAQLSLATAEAKIFG